MARKNLIVFQSRISLDCVDIVCVIDGRVLTQSITTCEMFVHVNLRTEVDSSLKLVL